MNTFLNYVLLFFVYSAIGWLGESIYCSVAAKKWINSGFLKGPICPIYGTGAVVMSVCLSPIKQAFDIKIFAAIAVFFAGMVICDIVEFITSVLMEKLFHARWWDYSGKKFNIQGRICLTHTIYWGIASVLFMYIADPVAFKILKYIPLTARNAILALILFVFAADLINAVRSAMDIRALSKKLQKLSDNIAAAAETVFLTVEEKYDELQFTVSKGTAKFGAWTKEVNSQLDETKDQLQSFMDSISSKARKKPGRIMRGFPYLETGLKNQVSLLEELMIELKNRITDEDDEMF